MIKKESLEVFFWYYKRGMLGYAMGLLFIAMWLSLLRDWINFLYVLGTAIAVTATALFFMRDEHSPSVMPSSKATRGRALGSEAVRSEDEGS